MLIGCGASESKTECAFFPPPQFFQHLEKTNAAASTIQRAFKRAQRARAAACTVAQHAPQDLVPTIPALPMSPATESFPIGCRVIIALSHPQHANTYGVVTRYTAKFVTFAPKDCSQESIRILPKLLILAPPLATPSPPPRRDETRTQDRIAAWDDAEEGQTRTQGRQERDNISYDALPETTNFPVSDGHVSFTRTFRYLGSLINYSLRDGDDITAQITSATAAMGALKEVSRNPHLDVYNKYLLFQAIPMNLLLWGAKTWSLRKSQIDQLDVFLHRHPAYPPDFDERGQRRKIWNQRVREMFYSIPCVRNMITARQKDFIGKMMRGPPDQPSRNMITACCDHKRRVGRPQTTGEKIMVENLRLLFQDVNTVHIDCFGSL